jgi:Cu+-exporting ATPase
MTAALEERTVRLELEGMTCAACAARIEKKLNRVDGVEATVNFATEQATVRCDASVPDDELLAAVAAAGYDARVAASADAAREGEPLTLLRRRLVASVALTVPVALLAMVPPLQFDGWEWLALALTAPVVGYAGLGFHRAALKAARHAAASMDTLISLGGASTARGRWPDGARL